jgi:hypothetical protein
MRSKVRFVEDDVLGWCRVVDRDDGCYVETPSAWEVRMVLSAEERRKFLGLGEGPPSVLKSLKRTKLGLSGDEMVRLGMNVRELRLRAEETQYVLAERTQIFQTYISMLERGVLDVSEELLSIIAVHYGVSLDYLLGRDSPVSSAS